jgi:hypothetical protein
VSCVSQCLDADNPPPPRHVTRLACTPSTRENETSNAQKEQGIERNKTRMRNNTTKQYKHTGRERSICVTSASCSPSISCSFGTIGNASVIDSTTKQPASFLLCT